jgi:hypothetical protein
MVALNACETGREDPLDAQPSSTDGDANSASGVQTNLARIFVQCGVPSVLAMSHQICASFVTVFYKSFYSALLKSESDVVEAVSIARQSLMSQKQRAVNFGLDVELSDWIIPVLYQSHIVTFEIVTDGDVDSEKPSMAESQRLEAVPARKKLFKRVFNRDSLKAKDIIPSRSIISTAPQSTDRMLGRGLEILYVEALLLPANSRKTLFLFGKYGIGKTHFVKGLGNLWARTNCIAHKPFYIDCSANPNWKAVDVLRAILRTVIGLDNLNSNVIEKAQTYLRNSQELIIVDNIEPGNLSSDPGVADATRSLQSFLQSLAGGKSILMIVSREDLRDQTRLLSRETKSTL